MGGLVSLANATPNYAVLALGLRRPVEQTMGVVTQLQAERVLMALRADADTLKTAARRSSASGFRAAISLRAAPCGQTPTKDAARFVRNARPRCNATSSCGALHPHDDAVLAWPREAVRAPPGRTLRVHLFTARDPGA